MFRKLVLLALAWLLVPTALVVGGPAGAATARAAATLRVGSYNISGVHTDSVAGGDHKPWKQRRDAVASTIMSRKLAVVGLQEANPSTIYKDKLANPATGTQFADLLDAVNKQGGNYALTTTQSYNCVRSTSSKNCSFRDYGSAGSNRIIYDRDLLSLSSKGSMKYDSQTAGKYDRYLEWAVFTIRANGAKFLFTNTHLDPYNTGSRERQWREALAKTAALRGSLPVVSVGDYNSHKFSAWSERMLPATRKIGLSDPLNTYFATNPTKSPRAEKITNAWLGSFNGYRTDVKTWSAYKNRAKQANQIDWIFSTSKLRITDYEVVASINASTLRATGLIPSDHNLVRATFVLP